ncbi:MAG: Nif3-like dinuclear metal center hexameric protein [Deltaproteobacteria bacterium]|nr:Nif3-like dinuclear metal center hexameric protein [Deltaproteobacteria bacterium]MBW2129929.1 Nif3-like dinuclear metal center hexameric protein [Deltaproteobacteria bacterium]MBW2305090.1 Nif3-like dinuclear metal center hexameric protein [Deltaproteobacteria bacterium]
MIQILELLEEIAPPRLAEEWDNPGMQVGCLSLEIDTILIALDPSLEALKDALKQGAQLLFTHHPLLFRSLSCLDADSYPGDVIALALKNDISIVAAHTNLDVAKGGINDQLAELFQLTDIEILQEHRDPRISEAGLGRIGSLPHPLALKDLVHRIKKALNIQQARVTGDLNQRIHRVAVVGGSGAGLLSLASKKGADVLVTGDVGHHHAREAEAIGVAIVDGGHFHTEWAAFMRFAGRLEAMFKDRRWEVTIKTYDRERPPQFHI